MTELFAWSFSAHIRKGSRNKLSQDFIERAYAAWRAHGKDAFEHMATKEPSKFVQTIAALIPQHFKFEHEHKVLHLTEEQIERRLLELADSRP